MLEHSTTNCLAFKNTKQGAFKEGCLRLGKKGNEMQVDANPFSLDEISMVSASSMPLRFRQKDEGQPRQQWRLKKELGDKVRKEP